LSLPLQKNMLPLQKEHFERWLALFNETVAGSFEGANAKRI